jgi:signal transduction histidine kinase
LCEAGDIVRLFQNVIGNAIKYRSHEPPKISIRCVPDGGRWVVGVRDNGIGIAPQYLETIFGLFKRLHGKDTPGTGIGLAICQRIVERHGGTIWAESEPGRGSAFYFTLPVDSGSAPASGSNSQSSGK